MIDKSKYLKQLEEKLEKQLAKDDLIIVKIRENINTLTSIINSLFVSFQHYAELFGIKPSLKKISQFKDLRRNDVVYSSLIEELISLLKLKEKLENKEKELVRKLCPNASYLVGETLVAKFIHHVGSLEKLAKLPSSSIQILGAEKALFKHLKKGTKPPKHGLLFQHPLVSKSKKKLRGKIARAIASKLSIAFKIDYYSKEDRREELKKELEEELAHIYGK